MIREHITMHCDECGRALIVSPEAPEPLPPTLLEPGAAYATVFASHSAAFRAATARKWYVDARTHLCVVCLAQGVSPCR